MSTYIRSRRHGTPRALPSAAPATLGAALLSLPLALQAQTAPAPDATTLPTVSITASPESAYKADTSASPKLTQPLLDTPKSVQVIKKELIQQQGAATLTEALRNTPGITLQLGENGNTSAGDTFQMRGFSTQTSTFVDGIRDLGAVTRDVFNVEQVEVVKGPAGADIGRGAAGGYVNLISKLPEREERTEGSLTLGTADTLRATADIGRGFAETSAWRLNVMTQDSGVDGRDEVKNKGWAVAPGVAFGLNTPTRLYLYSQHAHQDNVPDGGIPTIGMSGFYNADSALNAGAKVDRHNFYGSRDDYEKVDADMFTVKFEHDLAPGTTVRNLTRYGQTHMDRVLTGIYTLAAPSAGDPATWTVSRIRQRTDQANEILTNQTSVSTRFETAGIRHDLAAGVELIYERQLTKGTGTTAQTINGVSHSAINNPNANLYHPDPSVSLGVPYLTGADTEGKTTTGALYLLDTLTLNEAWKLNAGLRFERYHTETSVGTLVTSSNSSTYPGYAVGSIANTNLRLADNLTSWNLGLTYKPAEHGSVYLAVANAYTPPGGANFALSATTTSANTAGNNPDMDPQQTRSVELGTKWDLLDQRLNLTLAAYHTENDKQISYDDLGNAVQTGKTRVQGVELGLVGQITRDWQLSAGIATMDTKQSDVWNSTHTTATNGVRWSPDLTASFWTSYRWGDLTLGGGANYVAKQKRTITADTDLSTQNMPEIPAYWVANLMASYQVMKNLRLQLNVGNVFDKEYISTLNNSGARATLGAPRSAKLTASVQF
ncbi:catecholate siderophore receptor Fiu [Ideonella sp. B7]|uniref:catecholate siderophore receptor Fiu n=1 Tax=Ideonella benzenivorans TaxID=2831643 RepID=UPI001CECFBB3|nr:catecholate siderophore receptor Fiu [Ideonella benzenivorans]MCA6216548.1 catecholate siderophore receptor Fiu [Ideonella benzenivorans]